MTDDYWKIAKPGDRFYFILLTILVTILGLMLYQMIVDGTIYRDSMNKTDHRLDKLERFEAGMCEVLRDHDVFDTRPKRCGEILNGGK